MADLGRHLNPANWIFLQHIDELCLVTAPEVLALYQTRSVLQTLTSRGFDKSRIRLVLNRNRSAPQDFWVESIEQMFEMNVFAVIPNDYSTLDKSPRDRFEFPADTPFGKAVVKLAGRLTHPNGPGSLRKAA
jgi:Flp pilus assembly CpaE family ATPase